MNSRAAIHSRILCLVQEIPSFSPFLPFIKEALMTYEGVQSLDKDLDVAFSLQGFLEHVVQHRVDEVDDSVLARFFLGLPIHNKIVFCKLSQDAWNPVQETFVSFADKRCLDSLSIVKWKGSQQDILDWMVMFMGDNHPLNSTSDGVSNVRH